MRKLLLTSAAVLGLAAGPVLAQTMPAMPPAAPDTAVPAAPGMTGMRAMRGQQREAVGMHAGGMRAGGTHRATPVSAKPGSTHRAQASQSAERRH